MPKSMANLDNILGQHAGPFRDVLKEEGLLLYEDDPRHRQDHNSPFWSNTRPQCRLTIYKKLYGTEHERAAHLVFENWTAHIEIPKWGEGSESDYAPKIERALRAYQQHGGREITLLKHS
jgi:hypothetical protein